MKIDSGRRPASLSLPCAATLIAASLASSMPGSAHADPPVTSVSNPIATAKTIQLKESFGSVDKNGVFQPGFTMVVQIDKSTPTEKVRIDMPSVRPLTAGQKAPKVSEYLLNGKNEYEYNGLINTYTVKDPIAPGMRSHSQMRDMAAIDLILYPERSAQATEGPGIVKTVTNATLDGKAMILTSYAHPARKGNDGKEYTSVTRFYADAATGLPFRRDDCSIQTDGPTRIFMETNFSDWKLDAPVPAAQFAWVPPAGSEMYTGPKLLAAGKTAPDFTAYAADGKAVKLSDFKGEVVILDFWATWCGPCQRSMPHLDSVYKKVRDEDVVVLAVCVWDKKDEYTKWVAAKKDTYSFPTVFDPAGRDKGNIAGGLYLVTAIPTQYVIDKDGKIASGHIGFEGDSDHSLEIALTKLGIKVGEDAVKTASLR